MAHIVPFRSAAARAAEDVAASAPNGAEIIIFPGVRRERHAETQTSRPPPSTRDGRRQRDVIELPD